MSMFSMSGKTVLIVGGAGYLGLPVCEGLRAQGASLYIADHHSGRLADAKAVLEAQNGEGSVQTLPIDMGDEASILACIDQCPPLHGLVMATAGSSNTHFDQLTSEDYDRSNRINLTGTFVLARAAAKAMPDGGAMVFYSSMYGTVAPDPANYPGDMPPNPVDYGAGKAGISQMARYMAGHFGRRGIRVNAIAPGPFPPQAVRDAHPDFITNLTRDTMMGRMGKRHETAGAVVFLLSDASSYITGQVLGVDGGWTAW
ncbi:SDR family NAD(P)-dependent oxidoreductase [Flavimaricola marinus]|uniref:Gluconate 5-dehydrogenase n=1 Tax=Flavimaricola marinus TaxID=1819565 RepID=A0A238LGM4_9RHOB|nr:SDR family oxidoreductase [Flavimaricola marinus]SMY08887.1 Gluconate 5-dehydrogenase [Flavimaricola marinus]